MSKTALVLLADGAEEMEMVTVCDILARGKVNVVVAGITGSDIVTCSRGIKIMPDVALTSVLSENYDLIFLPGGLSGTKTLSRNVDVGTLLKNQLNANKYIAAMCAAPCALKEHKIALGAKLTSYPGMKNQLKDVYEYIEKNVVVDGNLLTSRGPGTAAEFGLQILEILTNKETSESVARDMLL